MEWMGEMMDAPTWMGESQQLEGATFGLLTVEAPAAPSADGAVQVLCRCALRHVAGVDRAHLKLMREVFAVGRADAGQPRFHRRKVRR